MSDNIIIPIFIGLLASGILLSILYEPFIKQKFADLGALIQLQTSRPVYYGVGITPLNNDVQIPYITQGHITTSEQYNYYPSIPLNKPNNNTSNNTSRNNTSSNISNNKIVDLAFSNPQQVYDSHKAFYWALSGGYPYPYRFPFPIAYHSSVDMNKVQASENKI